MNREEAKRFGREDAESAVAVARETPIAGTTDPDDLNLPYDWPRKYRDSPELPARRIASYWDDLDPGTFWPEGLPTSLVKFGHAKEAFDGADEDIWTTYVTTLNETAQAAEVIFIETVYMDYPYAEMPETYILIASTYVADLRRYEMIERTWRTMDYVAGEGRNSYDERCIMDSFIPRSMSGRARRRRIRQLQKRVADRGDLR